MHERRLSVCGGGIRGTSLNRTGDREDGKSLTTKWLIFNH